MKFWDTIAKMCGIAIYSRDESVVPCKIGGGSVETLPGADVHIGRHRLSTWYGVWKMGGCINGHGVQIVDTTAVSSRRGFRIGFIDIERIRPMKGKSGSFDAARATEAFVRMAESMNAQKPTVLS